MKTKYRFDELSKEAQRRAVRDYIKGWEESREWSDDSLSSLDVFQILMKDKIDEDFYTKTGKYIEE